MLTSRAPRGGPRPPPSAGGCRSHVSRGKLTAPARSAKIAPIGIARPIAINAACGSGVGLAGWPHDLGRTAPARTADVATRRRAERRAGRGRRSRTPGSSCGRPRGTASHWRRTTGKPSECPLQLARQPTSKLSPSTNQDGPLSETRTPDTELWPMLPGAENVRRRRARRPANSLDAEAPGSARTRCVPAPSGTGLRRPQRRARIELGDGPRHRERVPRREPSCTATTPQPAWIGPLRGTCTARMPAISTAPIPTAFACR